MSLNIISPAQIITVNAIKLYFYGDPGMYKTTLGMTANKALIIDADKGAYRTGANRRADVVVAECWNDIANISPVDLEPYQTVVFDTIGRVLDLVKAHLANDRKNTKGDGSLKLNVQGVANTMFSTFVNKIITSGRDVVFIAHATEDKNDNLTLIRPDLGGKNRQEIYRLCDAMAYLCLETNKQGIQERVLKFESQEGYHSKDAGGLGNVPVPDLRQSQNSRFLGDLIEQVKTTLNTMTPEQQEAQKLKLEWEQWEKSCIEAKFPSDFNALMDELKQEHPNFKNMWNCMKHFAYQLGFTYNKQNTKWIELEVRTSTVSDTQRDELQAFIDERGLDTKTVCEHLGIDALNQIEESNLQAVKNEIENLAKLEMETA